jgi:TRAP-type C4-dicarboxylate transport system permease small subunit
MSTRRFVKTNSTALYVVAVVIIIVAFLLLGGGQWMSGMMHNGRSMGTVHLDWVQIFISLAIGFVLGLLASRRKW